MKSKMKIAIGIAILVVLVAGAVVFSQNSTLKGDMKQLVKLGARPIQRQAGDAKSQPGVNKEVKTAAPPSEPVDVCLNWDGVQTSVPAGYALDATGHCLISREQAGVLTVEADRTVVSRSILRTSVNAPFTTINLSTSGILPVKVSLLSVIATTGNTNIDFIRLYDENERRFITEPIRLDALGKARIEIIPHTIPLFTVTPGVVKRISILGTVRGNAEVGTQTAFGLYIESSPDDTSIDNDQFYGTAGEESLPILYDDLTTQFSDGSSYMPGHVFVSFRDNITYNPQFHVVAGNPMTIAAN